MSNYSSADVYVVDVDLSQELEPAGVSVGAIVLCSEKGEIGKPIRVLSVQDYLEKFGQPNISKYGYGAYAALAFLRVSNTLFVSRAVSGAYAYAGLKVANNNKVLTGTGAGIKKPENISFTLTDMFYIHRVGPGLEGNNYHIEIVSKNMPTPVLVAATTAVTGGEIVNGTYDYKLVAYNSLGNTVLTSIQTVTTTGTNESIVELEITASTGAVGYKIFRKTNTGTFGLLETISNNYLLDGSGNFKWTDTGENLEDTSIDPDATEVVDSVTVKKYIPVYTPTEVFAVNIYDERESMSRALESWEVTLKSSVDGFGQQQQIAEKINLFSNLVRVYMNDAYDTDNDIMYSMKAAKFAGGADGDGVSGLPMDSAFMKAWDTYADKENISVNILIEGGRGSVAVQQKMDNVAKARGDAVCILDLPSAYQDARKAVDWRNFTQNIYSNRSTLYTPDLKIQDEYNDMVIFVPPSGYIASVYAYTDATTNAWFAPAGLNRGLLNVLGIRHKYTLPERDMLSDAKINYVRAFAGMGIAVWECWTLQSKLSAFSFVNVRRLFDLIGVSVAKALLYSEFEPNDDFLKRQIVSMIGQYLETIQNARGINAFQVVCDSTNQNALDTARGLLHVDVYIQPTLPVRIIQLKLVATKQGVSISEVIGQA